MFKITASAGGWADIYVSPRAGERLRQLMPPTVDFQGRYNNVLFFRLAYADEGPEGRPSALLLVVDGNRQAEASFLLAELVETLPRELRRLIEVKTLKEVESEIETIRRTCADLDNSLPLLQTEGSPPSIVQVGKPSDSNSTAMSTTRQSESFQASGRDLKAKMTLAIPGTWLWSFGVACLIVTLLTLAGLIISVRSFNGLNVLEQKYQSADKNNDLSSLERQIRDNRRRAADVEKALLDVELQVERITEILRGRAGGTGLLNQASDASATLAELQKKIESLNTLVEALGGNKGISSTLAALTNELKIARSSIGSRVPSGIWTKSEILENRTKQTEIQLAGIVVSGPRLSFSVIAKKQREGVAPEIALSSAKIFDGDSGFLLGEAAETGTIAEGGSVFQIDMQSRNPNSLPASARLVLSFSGQQSDVRPRSDLQVRIIVWNSP